RANIHYPRHLRRPGEFDASRPAAIDIPPTAGEYGGVELDAVRKPVAEVRNLGAQSSSQPLTRQARFKAVGFLGPQLGVAHKEGFFREILDQRGLLDSA